MKQQKPGWVLLAALLTVATCGVFFLHGCGQQSNVAGPGTGGTEPAMTAVGLVDRSLQQGSLGMAAGGDLDYLRESPYYLADSTAALVVDAAGGDIRLWLDDQAVVFHVPAGAVTDSTEIEIRGFKFRTPYGDAWLYDCSPEGTQFAVPLWVDHPISRNDGAWSVIVLYDDLGQSMTLEQVSAVEDGIARFQIRHFSKYGIS